jgi:hypothetical protein
MYSTGSQRQPLSVMSHIGISESYDAISGKKRKRQKKDNRAQQLAQDKIADSIAEDFSTFGRGGSLRQLSSSMVDIAKEIASTGLFATSYDNINMVFRSAEQILGRTGVYNRFFHITININSNFNPPKTLRRMEHVRPYGHCGRVNLASWRLPNTRMHSTMHHRLLSTTFF